MFSIEQRRFDFLHVKNTTNSPQSSYPQHHFENHEGERGHQGLNDETKMDDELMKSALGVMSKKKSMYAFHTSCLNEVPSFPGACSIGESSESSLERDYGITPVAPTSPAVSARRHERRSRVALPRKAPRTGSGALPEALPGRPRGPAPA